MSNIPIMLETKKGSRSKVGHIIQWSLVIITVAFCFWGTVNVVQESTSDNFKVEIKNLNNEVLAQQKITDNQKMDYEAKIKDLNDQLATKSAEAKQSVLLDVKAYVDSKLNPPTAQVEPVKK